MQRHESHLIKTMSHNFHETILFAVYLTIIMGIVNLLPLVNKAQRTSHLKEFQGQKVAIDGNIWAFRGAYSCARALAKQQPTTEYVKFFMNSLVNVQKWGLIPIIVFDGKPHPAKRQKQEERKRDREMFSAMAAECEQRGDQTEADRMYRKSVEVTPAMIATICQAVSAVGIQFVVAPFEADAQLAYLSKIGHVDLIITEDSDLIPFGCRKVFFKWTQDGSGMLYERERLSDCFGVPRKCFNFKNFRRMCILSGCDYLPSIKGIGLKKAMIIFPFRGRTIQIDKALCRIPLLLKLEVPHQYTENFIEAEKSFLSQSVLDIDGKERSLNAFRTKSVHQRNSLVPLGTQPPLVILPQSGVSGKTHTQHPSTLKIVAPVDGNLDASKTSQGADVSPVRILRPMPSSPFAIRKFTDEEVDRLSLRRKNVCMSSNLTNRVKLENIVATLGGIVVPWKEDALYPMYHIYVGGSEQCKEVDRIMSSQYLRKTVKRLTVKQLNTLNKRVNSR